MSNRFFVFCLVLVSYVVVAQQIVTIFGTFNIDEPVFFELLESNAMQRLKRVEQSGIGSFVRDSYSFTRYEHSVGVCMLCRLFGATLEEQVAALLHDASHTVFSHVGDLVFNYAGDDAYQDAIHEKYIKQTDAFAILQKYNMTQVITDTAKERFRVLEQDLPDICADRIEYNLHVGFYEKDISSDDVIYILSHIKHLNNQWYFDDAQVAYRFGMLTIALTERLWGSAWNGFINKQAAAAIRRAVSIGLITHDDIHFGIDEDIWGQLQESHDKEIQTHVKYCKEYQNAFRVVSSNDHYDYHYKPKCRAVDPFVATSDGMKRLSEVNKEYALCYHTLKDRCKEGYYLQYRSCE